MAATRTFNGRSVLTTGQVAEICHVAARTVSKWFDAGRLGGYRIPGSRDRRIPVEQLLAFMQAHGMPADALDGGACRVLIVDSAPTARRTIQELAHSDRYDVRLAATEFEAGVTAEQFSPHVIVLTTGDDPGQAAQTVRNVRATPALQSATLIAVAPDLTDPARRALARAGFDACLAAPYSPAELVRAVERATDLIT